MSTIATNAAPERTTRWLLIGAVAAALVTGVLVFAAMANFGNDEGSAAGDGDAQVLVADQTIRAGAKLEGDMFRLASFSEDELVPDAVANPEAIIGQTLTSDLLRGQQLSRTQITTVSDDDRVEQLAFKLPDGYLGYGVQVDEVAAVGGLLVPGDRVDVVATYREKESREANARTFKRVSVVLQNVLVVAVEQTDVDRYTTLPGEEDDDGGQGQLSGQEFEQRPSKDPEEDLNSVTLALLPEQIPLMAMVDANAEEVKLALRKFGDTQVYDIPDIVVEIFD